MLEWPLIKGDETHAQGLNEVGKSVQSKSFMWAQMTASSGAPEGWTFILQPYSHQFGEHPWQARKALLLDMAQPWARISACKDAMRASQARKTRSASCALTMIGQRPVFTVRKRVPIQRNFNWSIGYARSFRPCPSLSGNLLSNFEGDRSPQKAQGGRTHVARAG